MYVPAADRKSSIVRLLEVADMYLPAADIAKGPLHDIIDRLESLPAFSNSVPQTDAPSQKRLS
jgi:hypothetical protein